MRYIELTRESSGQTTSLINIDHITAIRHDINIADNGFNTIISFSNGHVDRVSESYDNIVQLLKRRSSDLHSACELYQVHQ